MHGGSQRHEDVPDGVGEGDDAVALEEEDAEAVDEAAARQLLEALGVVLEDKQSRPISTLRSNAADEARSAATMEVTTEAGKKPMVR